MKKIFRWRVVRWVLLGLAIVLVAIQFVPVTRSNPSVEADIPAPTNVKAVLRRACYDCHSNETVWPWYSRVAPASWLLASDVSEGRRELNFSTWNRMSAEQQAKKIRKSSEEVSEGEMPPWYYLIVHRDARLTAEDRTTIHDWASNAGPEDESKNDK